ncbi:hypothetical protein CVT26_004673 [Gymnopilus dilepis]|uniref:Uncharacterized protein n=1 Tax=Gymnopilus dilepis TaxID=231916 RepID=A0A409YJA4_9AGAR|nr:hypothetical protein CVT26_004673 [Gymnopilus dilepis]
MWRNTMECTGIRRNAEELDGSRRKVYERGGIRRNPAERTGIKNVDRSKEVISETITPDKFIPSVQGIPADC